MTKETPELKLLQNELAGKHPRVILQTALSRFQNIALSFSGAEDVVLVDMAAKIRPDIQVFTLDTGRLHPETYGFLESVKERYGIRLEVMSPDPIVLQQLTAEKGLFSFYRDGHAECCGIRKVEPLRRRLRELDAWITGQRRDQSLTRSELAEVELDGVFTGKHADGLYKFNPLAHWSSSQVWDYIEAHDVPFNPLHAKGYLSIGCEPCTRAVLPNQHERQGRWWWEDGGKKECGLHAGNLNSR